MSGDTFRGFLIGNDEYTVEQYTGDGKNIEVSNYKISFNGGTIIGNNTGTIGKEGQGYTAVWTTGIMMDAGATRYTLNTSDGGMLLKNINKEDNVEKTVVTLNDKKLRVFLKDADSIELLNSVNGIESKEGGLSIGAAQTIIKSDANSRITIKPTAKSSTTVQKAYTSIQIDGSCMYREQEGEEEKNQPDIYGNIISKIKGFGMKTAAKVTEDIKDEKTTLSLVQTVYSDANVFDLYPVWVRSGLCEGRGLKKNSLNTFEYVKIPVSSESGLNPKKVTNEEFFGLVNKVIVYKATVGHRYDKKEYYLDMPLCEVIEEYIKVHDAAPGTNIIPDIHIYKTDPGKMTLQSSDRVFLAIDFNLLPDKYKGIE